MGQSIEDIIFDLYMTMKYKGYTKLELFVDGNLELQNVSAYELPLSERSKNAFIKKNLVSLEEISAFICNKRKVTALRGYGANAQADTKHAILYWWINYNLSHGRKPLTGIRLARL